MHAGGMRKSNIRNPLYCNPVLPKKNFIYCSKIKKAFLNKIKAKKKLPHRQ
jgi:hypothetical protein